MSATVCTAECAAGFANYALDRQGTVTATTNQSGGLVNTYRYYPWGSSVGTTGTQYNEYRYAGTYRIPPNRITLTRITR